MPAYLTEKQILLLHSMVIDETGGTHGVRDRNALLALAALPKQILFGKQAYPTLFLKAAVYVRNIITGHPFIDGNKRTGMIVAGVFLENNGYKITAPKGAIESYALLAGNKKPELASIAAWLKKHAEKR